MATNYFTTDYLLEDMRLKGFIPQGNGLTSTQCLSILSSELRVHIPSVLKAIREEYLIVTIDIPVTSSTIPAPKRAVGAAFRTVQWLNTSGKPFNLDRIEPENAVAYQGSQGSNPSGYVFQGNNIILVPSTFTTGTLRVGYQQRPGTLVFTDACGEVTNVNALTGQVTVATAPSTFTNTAVFDFVSGTPNFQALAIDRNTSGTYLWVANVVTMPVADAALLSVGDFICLANETCIVPLPQEVHEYLAQAGAVKIAQAQNSERLPAIKDGLKDLKDQLVTLLSPRSDGSARPIVHRRSRGYGNFWGG